MCHDTYMAGAMQQQRTYQVVGACCGCKSGIREMADIRCEYCKQSFCVDCIVKIDGLSVCLGCVAVAWSANPSMEDHKEWR